MTVSYEASDGFIKVNAPFRTVARTLKQERKAFLPSFIERLLHGMNSSMSSRHSANAVTACNVMAGDSVSSISQRVIKVNAPFRTVARTLKQERKAFLPSFIERLLHGMNSSMSSRHSANAVTACNVMAGDSVSSISQRVKNVG